MACVTFRLQPLFLYDDDVADDDDGGQWNEMKLENVYIIQRIR